MSENQKQQQQQIQPKNVLEEVLKIEDPKQRKISRDEFQEKINYYNHIKREDLSGEIAILTDQQKSTLRKTLFNKMFMQTSSLDQYDRDKWWNFVKYSFLYTFVGAGIYKVSKAENFLGYNMSKTVVGRLFGQRYGMALFAPITVMIFSDFLSMSMSIGLKHRYIEENVRYIE